MNKDRRKSLAEAVTLLRAIDLETIKDILETAKDEEQEAFDNMSEGLQGSDRGQAMEAAVSTLEDVISDIESFDIEDMVTKIEEAAE